MAWFETWFDSPFYHILYKNRNDDEAKLFIDNLLNHLKPSQSSTILDLACGKGRHSVYLNSKNFNVYGCDLSPQSIAFAKQFESETLHFFEHDMRNNLDSSFDYIFNLFTSFGYFDDKSDNLKTLKSISNALKKNGTLVIDFFNANYVINHLIQSESKIIDGISFHISKKYDSNHIFKKIEFEELGKIYEFTEKVQTLFLCDFIDLFQKSGMRLKAKFGSYAFENFDENTSQRLIMVVEKIT